MFTVLSLVLVSLLAVAQGFPPEVIETCKSEHNLPDSDLEHMKNLEPIQSRQAKCFLACGMKKVGIITGSGLISADGIKASMATMKLDNQELVNKIMDVADHCTKQDDIVNPNDECETANNFRNCFLVKAIELGFKPPKS